MTNAKKSDVQLELKRIADLNDGILKPEDVVETAKSPKSPIHNCFTWDDGEAGHQYRLWEARQLIRCTVIIEDRTETIVPMFHSLVSDRCRDGGGYRETLTLLKTMSGRQQILEDALDELHVFEDKYKMLTELAEVFEAIRRVKK